MHTLVQFAHEVTRDAGHHSADNSFRLEEILDCFAFLKEFWIGGDIEYGSGREVDTEDLRAVPVEAARAGDVPCATGICGMPFDDLANPLSRNCRHGALLNNQFVAAEVSGNGAGQCFDCG